MELPLLSLPHIPTNADDGIASVYNEQWKLIKLNFQSTDNALLHTMPHLAWLAPMAPMPLPPTAPTTLSEKERAIINQARKLLDLVFGFEVPAKTGNTGCPAPLEQMALLVQTTVKRETVTHFGAWKQHHPTLQETMREHMVGSLRTHTLGIIERAIPSDMPLSEVEKQKLNAYLVTVIQ